MLNQITTYWHLLYIPLMNVFSYLLKDVITHIINKCYLSINLELFKIINSPIFGLLHSMIKQKPN